MSEQWMPHVTLELSEEQYKQLPRNPAYQYDFLHGTAFITPRPKYFHGILDFARWQTSANGELSEDVQIRPIMAADHETLPAVFAAAFENVQPFGGLDGSQRLQAAQSALEKTWRNGDGPVLSQASFTALHAKKKTPLGAILITLVPGGDPSARENYLWPDPPPPTWLTNPIAQPHLTWIFISPLWRTGGLGSMLLNKSVEALISLRYRSLWTTFLMGNDASMLWHWRNGFTLAPHPYSRRKMRR